jgi:hypothetical protein
MKREQLIEHMENGSRLMVDEATITTPEGIWKGHGVVHCEDGDFCFLIHLPEGVKPPIPPKGLILPKDFWKMEGSLENTFRFSIPSLGPCMAGSHNDRYRLPLEASAIELSPDAWDSMTHEEIATMLESLNQARAETDEQIQKRLEARPPKKRGKSTSVVFKGLLKDFKVLARNAGTKKSEINDALGKSDSSSLDTCHGKLGKEWEFALVQRGKDVEFQLKSRKGYKSKGPESDQRKLTAFLTTVGFLYGKHAWPDRLEHRRSGKLVLDRICAREKRTGSPHLPFPDRIWFNARVGNVKWDVEEVFTKAYQFFDKETVLSETVSQILFYTREATKKGVHNRISVISVCALLENLVRAICRNEIRNARNKAFILALLAEAKISRKKFKPEDMEFDALVKAVIEKMATNAWAVEKLFKRAFFFTGMKWEERGEEAFKFWKQHRNDILHDGRYERPDGELVDELYVESRLAGAINIFVLRLMEYEGIVSASAFEDEYKNI